MPQFSVVKHLCETLLPLKICVFGGMLNTENKPQSFGCICCVPGVCVELLCGTLSVSCPTVSAVSLYVCVIVILTTL